MNQLSASIRYTFKNYLVVLPLFFASLVPEILIRTLDISKMPLLRSMLGGGSPADTTALGDSNEWLGSLLLEISPYILPIGITMLALSFIANCISWGSAQLSLEEKLPSFSSWPASLARLFLPYSVFSLAFLLAILVASAGLFAIGSLVINQATIVMIINVFWLTAVIFLMARLALTFPYMVLKRLSLFKALKLSWSTGKPLFLPIVRANIMILVASLGVSWIAGLFSDVAAISMLLTSLANGFAGFILVHFSLSLAYQTLNEKDQEPIKAE